MRFSYYSNGLLKETVLPNGTKVSYKYDPFGRRVERTIGHVPINSLWEGNGHLAEMGASVGTRAHFLGETPFSSIAENLDGQLRVLLEDNIGAPCAALSPAGEILSESSVDLYGRPKTLPKIGAPTGSAWPGQHHDAESHLHYNRFRYYEPDIGAYLTPDPLGLAGGISAYAYAPDPTTYVDPLGLASCSVQERQQRILDRDVAYNLSPEQWFRDYPFIGRSGTFVTDLQGLRDALGPVRPGRYKITDTPGPRTISLATARRAERDLGLVPGSLSDEIRITRISGIGARSPRSPLEGNQFFLGPGKGLPNGAPEIVIDSIPTR